PVMNTSTLTPMNPGYAVVLNNYTGAVTTGIIITSNNNIIQGLVIQNFGTNVGSVTDIGISINGNNNTVLGCYIGVGVTGSNGFSSGGNYVTEYGIVINGDNNMIGNGTPAGANLISGIASDGPGGTYGDGIQINGNNNRVKGNMMGLKR